VPLIGSVADFFMKNGFSSIKKYGRPKDAAPNTEKEDFRNRD
jgi:hypothetical protein